MKSHGINIAARNWQRVAMRADPKWSNNIDKAPKKAAGTKEPILERRD